MKVPAAVPSGRPLLRWVRTGSECSDDALVSWMTAADEVGIDAPFGSPATLVQLLPEYLSTGRWPLAPYLSGGRLHYDRLRYCETDCEVHRLLLAERGVSLWPLSVSSDSIAVVRMASRAPAAPPCGTSRAGRRPPGRRHAGVRDLPRCSARGLGAAAQAL